MADHFNNLTPVEAELLALLAEECSEVAQICMKTLRHGLASYHPADGDRTPNIRMIAKELGHVSAATDLLCAEWIIDAQAIDKARREKLRNVGRYLHHAAVPERLTQAPARGAALVNVGSLSWSAKAPTEDGEYLARYVADDGAEVFESVLVECAGTDAVNAGGAAHYRHRLDSKSGSPWTHWLGPIAPPPAEDPCAA